MKNCTIKLDRANRKVIIEFDMDASYGDSKSGRTTIVSSSEGTARIDPDQPDLFLNLSVFRKKPKG